MGFKVPRRTALLTFENGTYAGAEIRVRLDCPISKFVEVVEQTNRGEYDEVVEALSEQLIDWNLEDDDGEPIPATSEGVASLPLNFIVTILHQWIKGQVEIPAPLGAPSSNGGRPPIPVGVTTGSLGS